MKKTLLSLLLFVALPATKAQVPIVFCPAGAEWHYSFLSGYNPSILNLSIKYTGDSTIGSQSYKVLSYTRFFTSCDQLSPTKTLIKQNGDTVFMRNAATQNNWQILFNFGAQVGQFWMDSLYDAPTSVVYHKFLVDSIGSVSVNGFVLRKLFLTHVIYTNNLNTPFGAYSAVITERFGTSVYLFDYYHTNGNSCEDIYNFDSFLCYTDSAFGTKQFTSFSCDYSNPVGIIKNVLSATQIKIYPNPGSGLFHVSIENPEHSQFTAHVSDISSREIRTLPLDGWKRDQIIDIEDLNAGVYILTIKRDKELVYSTKVIRE